MKLSQVQQRQAKKSGLNAEDCKVCRTEMSTRLLIMSGIAELLCAQEECLCSTRRSGVQKSTAGCTGRSRQRMHAIQLMLLLSSLLTVADASTSGDEGGEAHSISNPEPSGDLPNIIHFVDPATVYAMCPAPAWNASTAELTFTEMEGVLFGLVRAPSNLTRSQVRVK